MSKENVPYPIDPTDSPTNMNTTSSSKDASNTDMLCPPVELEITLRSSVDEELALAAKVKGLAVAKLPIMTGTFPSPSMLFYFVNGCL